MKRSYLYIISLLVLTLCVSTIRTLGLLNSSSYEYHIATPTVESTMETDVKKDSTQVATSEENYGFAEEAEFDLVEDASLPFIPNNTATPWADSVFSSLTPRERVAQLFMVAAYSNKDDGHKQALKKLIKEEKIGGLIFFQGDPATQLKLTESYQKLSSTPLWLGMDIEWGLSMRLSNSITYPYQMTLGAMEDDSLVYNMGAQIAKQMKRMGVHVSFSPVLDVNNNPNNPVIYN